MQKRFNNFADYNAASDADAASSAACPRSTCEVRRGRLGCVLRTTALLFALFVVALGSIAAFFYWRNVSAPIDVETASTGRLVGWLALRDLSVETPETRERLFDRYVETLAGEDGVVEPENLELPPQAKRFAKMIFAQREETEAELQFEEDAETLDAPSKSAAKRAPYLRLDYCVAPRADDSTQTSEFVLSDDVRPGPALLQRWDAARENSKNDDAPAVEKNVRLLVMQWFVAKRKAYDKAPDAEKARQLAQTVDELRGWQKLYLKIRFDAIQKETPRYQMLADFEKLVAGWNEFETPEELAKTLWFKDLIVAAVARQESAFGGNAAEPTPPRARKIASDAPAPSPLLDDVRRFGRHFGDQARRFLFQTPSPTSENDASTR